MEDNNYAVIMAGGIGTRFWPMSNSSLPKQFLDILGSGETLLQQTFRRLKKVCRSKNILVVTNRDYIDICRNQLPDLLEENILSEPARKNTAPCIAYASFKISLENPNARIIVAPSDHLILNEEEFIRSINNLATSRDIINNYLNQAIKLLTEKRRNEVLIKLKPLLLENEEIQFKVLSQSIQNFSKSYYPPRSKKIFNILNKLKERKKLKSTLAGCVIEKTGSNLSITRE